MLKSLERVFRKILESFRDEGPSDPREPEPGVRVPKRPRPSDRRSAVALAEPDDRDMVRALASKRR
jgi:hypothetical protein